MNPGATQIIARVRILDVSVLENVQVRPTQPRLSPQSVLAQVAELTVELSDDSLYLRACNILFGGLPSFVHYVNSQIRLNRLLLPLEG